MDGEGEVECRTACWHGLDFTFWGKDENFRRKEVQLDGVKEIHGIRLWVVQNLFDGS